ncbi:MAG TPA: transketolase C-terminal domain-containing protein [Beijerinckiaceae bacterium]|nr:transketolase C-terminal domain-containing protein [Beijerinckiaceae bacterium]
MKAVAMVEKSFAQAMVDALAYTLRTEPNAFVIGRGLTGHGSEADAERPLHEEFGARIIDPPTAESLVAAVGAGAAAAGFKVFVHLGTASFAFEAVNQIVNEAANIRYMSGGQLSAPVVFQMYHGIRGGGGPQHSHSPQAMFANCAGLQILLPSSPADAQGLLRTAMAGSDPAILMNHNRLLGLRGDVPAGDFRIPFGMADIKRKGRDVTVIATSYIVNEALKAAESLAADGVDVEVVDPRTAVPLDRERICDSVRKTGRLVVVDEANMTCSIASEIAATVAELAFDALKAPILRVARPDVPMPYSPPLEQYLSPNAAKIAHAIKTVIGRPAQG